MKSIETIKSVITSETESIKEINMWVSENISKEVTNSYQDIDSVVYNTTVKNLEKSIRK